MTNKLKETKSIIFDLDGTLWNPTNVIVKAWHIALKNEKNIKNPITEKDLQSVFGMQHDLIGETLLPYLDKDNRDKLMEKCYNQENDTIKVLGGDLYENLEEVLIQLSKNYKLYIVSNCQAGYVEAFYHYHKLDKYFLDFECSGNTGKSKGENIKLIIERNSIENPVYVGDTMGDFEATMENSIPFIYAKYGFGEVNLADHVIGDISELKLIL